MKLDVFFKMKLDESLTEGIKVSIHLFKLNFTLFLSCERMFKKKFLIFCFEKKNTKIKIDDVSDFDYINEWFKDGDLMIHFERVKKTISPKSFQCKEKNSKCQCQSHQTFL